MDLEVNSCSAQMKQVFIADLQETQLLNDKKRICVNSMFLPTEHVTGLLGFCTQV